MNELLLRRRALMMAQKKPEEKWDYEWYYTDGMPEDNGWVKLVSGIATSEMTPDGLKMTSPSYSYITYRNPERFNVDNGVMEAIVTPYVDTASGQSNRVCLGNGTSGIQVYPAFGYWRLMNNVSLKECTPILPFTSGTTYTVRLVLNGGYGSVYINDEQLVEDYDIENMLYSGYTGFWSQSQATGFGIFKSVKLKLNRIE